jgi:2-polyprenyl-6-methoxyphenol hydroxylase-like FAD-dependent oxidoreductase
VGLDSVYDVIVVGARVAGSVLAILLSQKGRRVLLLDRARFPSDTLSTHFFRAPALRAFNQVGILQQILNVAPKLTVNYNVVDGIVFPEPVDRPEDYPYYMCVRRITLDAFLNERVRQIPEIDFRENSKVEGLLYEDTRVNGVSWRSGGKVFQAKGKVVVGADGIRSSMAKWLQPKIEQEEPVNRTMYYAYYRGMQPNSGPAAEFHYRENNLVYCFPCDGELTLLAASVPIAHFGEFRRDPEGRLESELHSMSEIYPRLQKAKREGPVQGTGSISGYLRVPYGDHWALVGDAALAMDPWSGQGIDQATTHAVYLSDKLNEFLAGKEEWESAMHNYHQKRNEFSLKTFNRTCTYSRDLRPMTRAALETRGIAH